MAVICLSKLVSGLTSLYATRENSGSGCGILRSSARCGVPYPVAPILSHSLRAGTMLGLQSVRSAGGSRAISRVPECRERRSGRELSSLTTLCRRQVGGVPTAGRSSSCFRFVAWRPATSPEASAPLHSIAQRPRSSDLWCRGGPVLKPRSRVVIERFEDPPAPSAADSREMSGHRHERPDNPAKVRDTVGGIGHTARMHFARWRSRAFWLTSNQRSASCQKRKRANNSDITLRLYPPPDGRARRRHDEPTHTQLSHKPPTLLKRSPDDASMDGRKEEERTLCFPQLGSTLRRLVSP